MPVLSFKLLV